MKPLKRIDPGIIAGQLYLNSCDFIKCDTMILSNNDIQMHFL